ncbi:MAG: rhomboid family intramembrane serine protease, partial [Acidobacteriota bacterium]
MIPLRSSERIHSRTPVVIGLIVVNVLVFLYQLSLSRGAFSQLVYSAGIVPDTINQNLISLVTSMFLHGGWLHLIGNMCFLWAFGRNLEDRIGSGRFFAFYMLCGIAAAIIHVLTNAYSRVPTIGASGAIAGVMGAFLVKFPRTDIDTIFWFIFIMRVSVPAPYFLIYWFVIQLFSGVGSISEVDYTGGGVAWFAHVGGFIAGMILILLFKESQPQFRAWYEE